MKVFVSLFASLLIFLAVLSFSRTTSERTVCLKPFDACIFDEKTLFDLTIPTPCFFCRSGLIDLQKTLTTQNCKLEILSKTNKQILKNASDLVVFDFDERFSFKRKHGLKKYLRLASLNKVLFLFEPNHIVPKNYDPQIHKDFKKVFTWSDDLVDNKTYYKFYWPQPSLVMQDSKPFSQKKLCVMIAANKQFPHPQSLNEERRKAIFFFNCFAQDFDLYGPGWERENLAVYRQLVPLTEVTRLTLAHQSKIDCLKGYRFSLCYENLMARGYITEKIFDCFLAGCVPVYWGAQNIEEYIPSTCYIDRRKFPSNEALYLFLKEMSEADYLLYIEHIRNFLASPKAQCFSNEAFIETFCRAINLQNIR